MSSKSPLCSKAFIHLNLYWGATFQGADKMPVDKKEPITDGPFMLETDSKK